MDSQPERVARLRELCSEGRNADCRIDEILREFVQGVLQLVARTETRLDYAFRIAAAYETNRAAYQRECRILRMMRRHGISRDAALIALDTLREMEREARRDSLSSLSHETLQALRDYAAQEAQRPAMQTAYREAKRRSVAHAMACVRHCISQIET